MAVQGDAGTKEDIKTQFTTIEGVYRLLPLSEYSRPNRVAYNNSGGSGTSPPVRMSFVNLPESNGSGNSINSDRTKICFNYGRELFVYTYRGIKKVRRHGSFLSEWWNYVRVERYVLKRMIATLTGPVRSVPQSSDMWAQVVTGGLLRSPVTPSGTETNTEMGRMV